MSFLDDDCFVAYGDGKVSFQMAETNGLSRFRIRRQTGLAGCAAKPPPQVAGGVCASLSSSLLTSSRMARPEPPIKGAIDEESAARSFAPTLPPWQLPVTGSASISELRSITPFPAGAPSLSGENGHQFVVYNQYISYPNIASPGSCADRCRSVDLQFAAFKDGDAKPTSEQMLTVESRYPGDMAQSAFTTPGRGRTRLLYSAEPMLWVTGASVGRKRSRSNRPSCWSSISGRRIVQELSRIEAM